MLIFFLAFKGLEWASGTWPELYTKGSVWSVCCHRQLIVQEKLAEGRVPGVLVNSECKCLTDMGVGIQK